MRYVSLVAVIAVAVASRAGAQIAPLGLEPQAAAATTAMVWGDDPAPGSDFAADRPGRFAEEIWTFQSYGSATVRDDHGGVGGLDLLFRWHFHRGANFSLYVDGGGGFQQVTTNSPNDSHHNFRLSVGLGSTLELTDRTCLIGGARYLHVSNADTTDANDGVDTAVVYDGIMFLF